MIIGALSILLASGASFANVIPRHEGQHVASSLPTNNSIIAGPISSAAIHYPTNNPSSARPCSEGPSASITATAIPSILNSSNRHAPFPNATSTKCSGYGTGVPEPLFLSSTNTQSWDSHWSLHWPTTSKINTSALTTPISVPTTSSALASTPLTATRIPLLSASSHPCEKSYTDLVSFSSMFTPASSSAAATTPSNHNAVADPIIFDPGWLRSVEAVTSTVHITITASAGVPSPAASSQGETTITSKITSMVTKTIRASSASLDPSQSALSSSSPLLTSKLVPTSTALLVVHTSIISADSRCPYPFPGVYCGEPKTTLVTEARQGEASTTGAPKEAIGGGGSKEAGSCPYPQSGC